MKEKKFTGNNLKSYKKLEKLIKYEPDSWRVYVARRNPEDNQWNKLGKDFSTLSLDGRWYAVVRKEHEYIADTIRANPKLKVWWDEDGLTKYTDTFFMDYKPNNNYRFTSKEGEILLEDINETPGKITLEGEYIKVPESARFKIRPRPTRPYSDGRKKFSHKELTFENSGFNDEVEPKLTGILTEKEIRELNEVVEEFVKERDAWDEEENKHNEELLPKPFKMSDIPESFYDLSAYYDLEGDDEFQGFEFTSSFEDIAGVSMNDFLNPKCDHHEMDMCEKCNPEFMASLERDKLNEIFQKWQNSETLTQDEYTLLLEDDRHKAIIIDRIKMIEADNNYETALRNMDVLLSKMFKEHNLGPRMRVTSDEINEKETDFKIGDWVLDFQKNCFQANERTALPENSNLYTPWKPTEGEWCFFKYEGHSEYVFCKYGETGLDDSYFSEIHPKEFAMTKGS